MSYRQLESMSPTTESVHVLIGQVPTFRALAAHPGQAEPATRLRCKGRLLSL
jgi:hypothetical protein